MTRSRWRKAAAGIAAFGISATSTSGLAYEPSANLTLLAVGKPAFDGRITISASDISPDIATASVVALEMRFSLSSDSCARKEIDLLTITRVNPAISKDDPVGVESFTLSYLPEEKTFSIATVARPLVAGKRLVGYPIKTKIKSLDLLPAAGECRSGKGKYMGDARYKVVLFLNRFNGILNVGLDGKPLASRVNTPIYFGMGPTLFNYMRGRTPGSFKITQESAAEGAGLDLKLYGASWRGSRYRDPKQAVEGDLKMRFDAASYIVKSPTLYLGRNAAALFSSM